MTSLSQKSINNSLTRANSDEIAGFAMPSENSISLTLGASGTEYTAPENGYFSLWTDYATNEGILIECIDSETGAVSITTHGVQALTGPRAFIPVLKGQKIKIWYRVSPSPFFRFYYLKGVQNV